MQTIILNDRTFIHTLEFNSLILNVYKSLELLVDEYPNFNSWFLEKVIHDTKYGNRTIIIKQIKNEIAAIAILKNEIFEKKISTFRVIEKFQSIGIGSKLMEESMNILKTKHPKMTVSSLRIEEFDKILKKFDFEYNSSNPDYYKQGVVEFSFNGTIEQITPHNTRYIKLPGQMAIQGL